VYVRSLLTVPVWPAVFREDRCLRNWDDGGGCAVRERRERVGGLRGPETRVPACAEWCWDKKRGQTVVFHGFKADPSLGSAREKGEGTLLVGRLSQGLLNGAEP
jgi:hypothetical protein